MADETKLKRILAHLRSAHKSVCSANGNEAVPSEPLSVNEKIREYARAIGYCATALLDLDEMEGCESKEKFIQHARSTAWYAAKKVGTMLAVLVSPPKAPEEVEVKVDKVEEARLKKDKDFQDAWAMHEKFVGNHERVK